MDEIKKVLKYKED